MTFSIQYYFLQIIDKPFIAWWFKRSQLRLRKYTMQRAWTLFYSWSVSTAWSRKRGFEAGRFETFGRSGSRGCSDGARESSKPLIRGAKFKRRLGARLAVRGGSGRRQMGWLEKKGRSGRMKTGWRKRNIGSSYSVTNACFKIALHMRKL